MYSCTLNILIFSEDRTLETVIRHIPPAERFTHEVLCLPSFSQKIASTGDIIIFDTYSKKKLSQIRTCCKKEAIFIYCTEITKALTLSTTDYKYFDDIWYKPWTKDFIILRFKSILSKIKLKQDYILVQNYLDTTIDSLPDLIWFKDIGGKHLKVNNGFCRAVGKVKNDIQGKDHYYIWDIEKEKYEEGEYVCLETDSAVLQARKTCLFTEQVKSKYGMRQFKTYKSPLFDENNNIMGTVGIAHDVTDLENMDVELGILMRSMPFALLVKDEQGRIIKVNEKFENYFHIYAKDIVGKKYENFADCIQTGKGTINSIQQNPCGDLEIEFNFKETNRIFEVHEEQILDIFNTIVGHMNIFRDITIECTFKEAMIHAANTDFLTKLYNRRYFYSIIENNKEKNITLLYMDIDNFKKINDLYGHHTGDDVLITVSEILKKIFVDNIIARIGGDEFLVAIVGECDINSIHLKTQMFLNKIRETFSSHNQLQMVSVSIGIAMTNKQEINIDELIRQADTALYASKNCGKAQYSIYTPKLE